MQPLEEKDSSPLEDTEITRLIKVSRELGYKKQDKIPERNLVDFKPTSITQIAASSDHQKRESTAGSESADIPKTAQNENVIENKEGQSEDIDDNMPNSVSVDIEPNSQNTLEQKEMNAPLEESLTSRAENLENPSISEEIAEESTQREKSSELDSAEGITTEKEQNKETPPVSTQDESTSAEEAKQAGIEIGKKIAIEELENSQREALETFQIIIDNIKKKEAIDKTDLTQSILRAVTRLASERAGSTIDEHPEAFKNKIISFAEKIEQESKNLTLNLNPIDANLLKINLAKSLSDRKVEIKENSELFRGDFIFQMGAIEIGDLISEQILIEENEKVATIQKNEPEIDNMKTEQKAVGSDDEEAIQKIGKEKKSEIDNERK